MLLLRVSVTNRFYTAQKVGDVTFKQVRVYFLFGILPIWRRVFYEYLEELDND